jgi:hypothetical protein
VANPNDRRDPGGTEPEDTGSARDAGAERRIEQRREHDKEMDRREEEGFDQPQSSAQKTPPPGPRP